MDVPRKGIEAARERAAGQEEADPQRKRQRRQMEVARKKGRNARDQTGAGASCRVGRIAIRTAYLDRWREQARFGAAARNCA